MRLRRRAVLQGAAALATGVAVGPAQAAEALPDLVEVAGTNHKAMVDAALTALGGIGAFVKPGARVVVKPNVSFDNPPEFGTGTHPETMRAVLEACLAAGAKEVVVIENLLRKKERCLERTGLGALLKTLPQVKLRLLDGDEDFEGVVVPGGKELERIDLAKEVRAADVYINLPQAKHHSSAEVSFGMKNAMGVIRDRKKFHLWLDLHLALVDLARVIKPQLTLLDATRVLMNKGPGGPGEVAAVGKLIAGRNVVSVDAYGLGLCKFDGKSLKVSDVRHIALAGKAGLGETDVTKLRVKTITV